MKPIELLTNKNWGDEDIVNDLKTLKEALEKNIAELRYLPDLARYPNCALHKFTNFL